MKGSYVFAMVSTALFLSSSLPATGQTRARFDLETATIADINKAIDRGTLTSEQLVVLYTQSNAKRTVSMGSSCLRQAQVSSCPGALRAHFWPEADRAQA